MGWEPPSESVFNDEWVTVSEAQELARANASQFGERWLLDQLKEGLVIAVARSGPTKADGPLEQFVRVLPGLWKKWDDWGSDYFWSSGTAIFQHYSATGYGDTVASRFFDVRFDPASFNGKVIILKPEAPAIAVRQLAAAQAGSSIVDNRAVPLSRGDAEKFSRAILAGWPEATEELAYTKALLFFPDNRIPRDWLRGIFRVIRGPKKRGPPPKNSD
jgi:hypothetical protein